MHELAITEGIIRLVDSRAKELGFKKCLAITLAVGEFSGVEPGCIEYYFPIAAKGTAAENAALRFSSSPEPFRCYVENLEVE